MNEYAFQFAVLRYVHDPVTQEFINVGIVIYSREARYVKASASTRYSRLSHTFKRINGDHYRRAVGYIERRFAQTHSQFQQLKLFDDLPPQIEIVLEQVLPADDSSLVFGGFGGGLTSDLDAELARLYERLVERYMEREEYPYRTDDEVWQVYRREFDKRHITLHLSPAMIRTPRYHYEFQHAWKNERWYPIEPVSLDLVQERSILNKADRWIGRAANLADSHQIAKLYLLLGAPRRDEMQEAYENAVANLTDKMTLPHEIIEENDAFAFSERLAEMIENHQPPT